MHPRQWAQPVQRPGGGEEPCAWGLHPVSPCCWNQDCDLMSDRKWAAEVSRASNARLKGWHLVSGALGSPREHRKACRRFQRGQRKDEADRYPLTLWTEWEAKPGAGLCQPPCPHQVGRAQEAGGVAASDAAQGQDGRRAGAQ